MGAEETLPQPAVAEDSLNNIRLSTFDETDDLHRAATLGTLQRIDLVDSLDQIAHVETEPARMERSRFCERR